MAGWDDDEDDEETDNDGFSLTGDSDGWETFKLPETWEEWWEFEWESYDGDYEEFAVSADYRGEE